MITNVMLYNTYFALAMCFTALVFLAAASRTDLVLHGSQLQYDFPAFTKEANTKENRYTVS